MFSTDDTIVAIATPPGRGGIGVVRLSGPAAPAIASALAGGMLFEPRHATLAVLRRADGGAIDQAIVTHFPAPHSYTGDDVIELSAHGSPVVLDAIVGAALEAGARIANPGEFTFRAYLNGRVDLVQAEAVRDLIDAVTPLEARVAFDQLEGTLTGRLRELDAALLEIIAPLEASLDFPEEGYHFVTQEQTVQSLATIAGALDSLLDDARRGRVIREGLIVAIIGKPNAGKSSLFNRLAGAARAIVTDVPGTTRDLLTERVDVGGVPLTLVDTAGIRETPGDAIEEEGIARARQARDAADLAIVVLDRSLPLGDDDRQLLASSTSRPRVVVASKCDLPAAWDPWDDEAIGARPVSSLTDEGISALRDALLTAAGVEPSRDRAAIANLRHAALLEQARDAVLRAREAAAGGVPEEFVLADLHEARARFDEVTGARPQDEVLRVIFERFCIGK